MTTTFRTYSEITTEEIKEILQSLGYKLNDNGRYWRTSAVYRGGDNQTSLHIYKDTGCWRDYVAQTPFLPFEKLISASLKTNDSNEISKFIKKYSSGESSFFTEQVKKLEMEKIYPKSYLSKLLPHDKFYNEKGVSSETLRFFDGGMATAGQMYQRYVFPIFNEDGEIHGFSGRDMTDNSSGNRPKWKHIGVKSKWIYPLYSEKDGEFPVKDAIESKGEVILVESLGDMLRFHEAGIQNVLVIFGLEVSPSLICSLVSLNVNNIILSLNNDDSKEENTGLRASIKNYLKLIGGFDVNKLSICLPVKNDFGDMDESDFKEWEERRVGIDQKKQQEKILESSNLLLKSGFLPASYKSKVNRLRKFIS